MRDSATNGRPAIIQCRNVGIRFRKKGGKAPRAKLARPKDFWALHDISLDVGEGELVGIVGRNGAGKSTLALVLAGIYAPDQGQVVINARVSRLALGVGFRLDLTGRQNIFINGAYLGFSRRQLQSQLDDIIDFAELRDFIDEPLKHYSSGMRSRLAFSIASSIEPEVLLMDESFTTGDAGFRAKADRRMKNMSQKARTVVLISHDLKSLRAMCPRVIWLEAGRLMMDAKADEVLPKYREFCLGVKAHKEA